MSASGGHSRADYYWLYVLNAAVAALISRGYFSGLEPSVSDRAYIALVWLSHFGCVFLILGAATWVLTRAFRVPARRLALAVALLTLVQVLLFIDVGIYRINRYHINGYVISVVTAGFGEVFILDAVTVVTVLVSVSLFAAGQILFVRGLHRAYKAMPGLKKPFFRTTVCLILLLAGIDKAYYVYADFRVDLGKVRYTKLLPLYQPITAKRWAARHLKLDRGIQRGEMVPVRNSMLAYPSPEELPRAAKGETTGLPSFLVVVIDSWRYDMLDPQTTPGLFEFSKRCVAYRKHYCGGNSTHFGMFALLYGLYGTYWDSFLDEGRGSLMFDYLKSRGYELKIVSSTRLSFPPLRRTAFAGIADSITDELPGKTSDVRDSQQQQELFRWLDGERKKDRPFFALLFLDAPHFDYTYPEGFGKFQPAAKSADYIKIDPRIAPEPYKRRYRNAILYDDYLTALILEGVEKRGLLGSTVVMVTGDHGEEFMESGNFFHTNAFSLQQVQVPLLVHFPGRTPGEVRVKTSHVDIATTVFRMAGCEAPNGKLWQGESLLDPGSREYVITAGMDAFALMRDRDIVVLPTGSFSLGEMEIRDMNYSLLGRGAEAIGAGGPALLKAALTDVTRFRR